MGKHTQAKQSNGIGVNNDKTSPSFKLAHMFHVLDYHLWHFVKKVLAQKKPHERKQASESDSKVIVCENDHCSNIEATENSHLEVQMTNSSLPIENLPLPLSPQYKRSSSMHFSLTKSSRASRVGKMIIKEVTKRKGRHRRISTCPASSELERTDLANQHIEIVNEGLVAESNQDKVIRHIVDENNKKCDLCNTMKIECQLGVMNQENKEVDMLLQDISLEAIDKIPFKGKVDKSASFNHSKVFLDAICVLGLNKELSLRLSNDSTSSLRDVFLLKETIRSSKRKFLEKSGTFLFNEPSITNDFYFSGLCSAKAKSSIKEKNDSQQIRLENSNGVQIVGRRFKDLRQKIKHLIKENRKERKRIALDALLHKVPYGHKVFEEGVKGSPRVSLCESDRKSLDESLDKYCQLFETTSIGREEKMNIQAGGSSLTIMNENSPRWMKRVFGRMFSSPDLQMFLSHTSQGDDRHVSSIVPNRRTMSFCERKGEDDLNNNVTSTMHFDGTKETTFKYSEDYRNEESFSSVHIDEEDTIFDQGYNNMESPKALGVDFFGSNDNIIATHPTITTLGCHPQIDLYEAEGILLKDSESPNYSCIKVDEKGEKSPGHCISPSHHHVRVTSYELEEFNYVRDILENSGYLGTQLLGTWNSSDQPVNPSIYIELESCSLVEVECSPSKEGKNNSHLLLFDMINEALLNIYERSVTYWSTPLLSCCQTHQMPKGSKVLKEVWDCINWYMCCSKNDRSPYLDYITKRDLAKYDGWMNLQCDTECLGLEIEDSIFEDLLNECIS